MTTETGSGDGRQDGTGEHLYRHAFRKMEPVSNPDLSDISGALQLVTIECLSCGQRLVVDTELARKGTYYCYGEKDEVRYERLAVGPVTDPIEKDQHTLLLLVQLLDDTEHQLETIKALINDLVAGNRPTQPPPGWWRGV